MAKTQELDFLDDIGGDRETLVLTGTLKVMSDYANVLMSLMKGYMNDAGAVATGKLQESLRFRVTNEGFSYGFEILMDDYWKFLEEGVKGVGNSKNNTTSPFSFRTATVSYNHQQAIKRWIKVKGITAKKKPGKSFTLNTNFKTSKARMTKAPVSKEESLAWAIAANSKQEGLKPVKFLERALDGSLTDFKDALKRELGYDIVLSIKKSFD